MDLSKLTTKDLEEEIERRKSDTDQSNYDKFFACYSGKELLKKHSLTDVGVWMVYGEDPNCDYGGSHNQPLLGIYQGKLDDVIHAATNLRGFYTWGSGGSIRKVDIVKV